MTLGTNRSDSIANSVGFLAKTENLCSSYHFLDRIILDDLGKAEKCRLAVTS